MAHYCAQLSAMRLGGLVSESDRFNRIAIMAEEEGFEPSVGLSPRSISSQVRSTAQPLTPSMESGQPTFNFGGDEGIRTLEGLATLLDFESSTFNQLSHVSVVEIYHRQFGISSFLSNPIQIPSRCKGAV